MPINKIDLTDPINPLLSIYNTGWAMTNFTSSSAPQLPAGFTVNIQGVPYIVESGAVLPSGSPADGNVYVKITPDANPDTATAEFTNTFSGTWSDTYNGWYDGASIFLNVFMTKSGANYTNKGFWINYRERKTKIISDDVNVDGDISAGGNISATGNVSGANGIFSGNVQASTLQAGNSIITGTVEAQRGTKAGLISVISVSAGAIFDALSPLVLNVGDTCKLYGKCAPDNLTTTIYDCAYVYRFSSTRVYLYWRVGNSKTTIAYDFGQFTQGIGTGSFSIHAEY